MPDPFTRLAQVRLQSRHVQRAADWYHRVFDFQPATNAADADGQTRLRLTEGAAGWATELELRGEADGQRPRPEHRYHLAFTLADMPTTYALAIAAGGSALTQPAGRHGWILDLDGCPIHLVTRSSPRRAVGWRFVGLRVADMAASVAFYADTLGLAIEPEPSRGDGVLFTRVRPSDAQSARLSIQTYLDPVSSRPDAEDRLSLALLIQGALPSPQTLHDPDGYSLTIRGALADN